MASICFWYFCLTSKRLILKVGVYQSIRERERENEREREPAARRDPSSSSSYQEIILHGKQFRVQVEGLDILEALQVVLLAVLLDRLQ